MTFERYFRFSSYAMITCGTLALFLSGGLSVWLFALSLVGFVVAWNLEDTRWQMSERTSLIVVLVSLPLFYFDWMSQGGAAGVNNWIGVGALAHLILFLSLVKLLQVKADRDWLFLYLISFFELLLAAGLSISPSFLAALGVYAFFALATVVAFEIRKAKRGLRAPESELLIVPERTWLRAAVTRRLSPGRMSVRHLSFAAFCLLTLILLLSVPTFLIAPRFTGSALTRSSGGVENFVGFADTVTLGNFGRVEMNDRIVMRVRVEQPPAARSQRLRWRGVALDKFNGKAWSKSSPITQNVPLDRGLFKIDSTESLDRLTTQTFYAEPFDTPVLFVAADAVAIQGALPFVREDREGGLATRNHPMERISYKAYSDTIEPDPETLRADRGIYRGKNLERYLDLPPSIDQGRLEQLARQVIADRGAHNAYDKARAVESHLQQNYAYSLDMRAGGSDPVVDFLFNVRAGHCEYFATAMALMMRTQGVASRVVNGFQMGDYNDAADAYTVRQLNAHSWVEVYFPDSGEWIAFDPTPASAVSNAGANGFGIAASIKKYAEALELLWVQYVVAYDRQEQRSLAGSLRSRLAAYQQATVENADGLREKFLKWWQNINSSTSANGKAPTAALLIAALIFLTLLTVVARRVATRLRFGRRARTNVSGAAAPVLVVDFYERLLKALGARGLERRPDQTPLEFASTLGMPGALQITRAYNRVRYGERALEPGERREIEAFLTALEAERELGKA